jgi:hypothetical protein
MMKPVEEMFALCRALKAAGFELQADRIIRAADAFEASLRTDVPESWMANHAAFDAELAAGAAILKRHGGGRA